MSSGISNSYSPYVIIDRSFDAALDTSGSSASNGGVVNQSNAIAQIRDTDLTTFLQVTTTLGTTPHTNVAQIKLDFGKIFINAQLYHKVDLTAFSAGTNAAAVEYSADGSSWTTIHSTGSGANPQSYEENVTPFRIRYLRYTASITGGSSGGDACNVKLYECRLAGSE